MTIATILPPPRFVAYDQNGAPLTGGFVYTYAPGGTVPKLSWADAGETTANANPIPLDSAGSAAIYGSGFYQMTVTDALGNQIPAYSGLTQDFLSVIAGAGPALGFVTTFANIAALRANAAGQAGTVYVEGYYVPGDGGGGAFVDKASDTTSLDNAGTIIVDGMSVRWYRDTYASGATDKQFGAKVDGTTDDTAALQAAVTALQGGGGPLSLVAGVRVVSATINITAPLTVSGAGTGVGPGVMSGAGCSIVLCKGTFTAGDVFNAGTLFACVFRDFQIAGALGLAYTDACPRSSGGGIHIVGPTDHVNAGSVIENVATSGMFVGIHLERCAENTITTGCYHQAWGQAAFIADNGGTAVESSCGHVTRNQYFGNLSGAQTACMTIHCGYGDITANKFLGAMYGLQVLADQTVNIGSVMVTLNSFEENTYQSLFMTTFGPIIASVQIVTNQFSNITAETLLNHIVVQPSLGGAGSELYDISITDNNFNTQTTATGAAFISVNLLNGTIACNRGRLIGGAAYGLVAQSGDDQTLQILDNEWSASGGALSGTTGYLLQGACIVRDVASRAFTVALLPGGATDGSEIYVTDGHATNPGAFDLTVTNGGPGCIAWKMGGDWLTFRS